MEEKADSNHLLLPKKNMKKLKLFYIIKTME